MDDPSSQAEWRSEFARLRQRLDRLAMAQLDAVAALRAEFEALRRRMEASFVEKSPAPEPVADEPALLEPAEPPEESALTEPWPSEPEPIPVPPPVISASRTSSRSLRGHASSNASCSASVRIRVR